MIKRNEIAFIIGAAIGATIVGRIIKRTNEKSHEETERLVKESTVSIMESFNADMKRDLERKFTV